MNGTESKRWVTKKAFLNARNCPRWGWETLNGRDAPQSLVKEFLFHEGNAIGERAKRLFPAGIEITSKDPGEALVETSRAILRNPTPVLFEPAFAYGRFIARVDALVPSENGFSLIEVKAATARNVHLAEGEEYLKDLAYTVWVCRKAGLPVSSTKLWFLSHAYWYGESERLLFTENDCSGLIDRFLTSYESDSDQIADLLLGERPTSKLLPICKGCEFKTECFPDFDRYTIFHIPGINKRKLQEWIGQGITKAEEIAEPSGFDTIQKRAKRATISREPFLDRRALGEELRSWKYPIAYLDFETIAPAYPVLEHTGPYEKIVTQFSLHIAQKEGDSMNQVRESHREYLADPEDLRASVIGLAKAMVDELPPSGSIVTYHKSFESKRIKWLINWLDGQGEKELAMRLKPLEERIVDLEIAIRRGYYHPEFQGSYSIKHVLPAMIPALTYGDLEVHEGMTASCAFLNMVLGREEEVMGKGIRTPTREDLKAYCKMDTWAMVELHRKLLALLEVG